MDGSRVPGAAQSPNAEKFDRIHILWLTAGLGCDGDSISITAATQPSLEDLVLGVIPGVPQIVLHHPVLAYETGDDFLKHWYQADRGELDPFILVVEGSIPNESIKAEGYWAAFGCDPVTGQPIPTCTWIDRLAPKAWAVVAIGTCSAYGGIHAMAGNPTGCMGLPDYLGWDWKSKAGLPIVCVPGCPVQPDNFMETLLHLLNQAAGRAPMISLDEALRPTALFGATVHEGCDRGGYYEQADFTAGIRHAAMHRQARLLGPGGAMQCRQARLDGGHRRLPERRRRLHWLHDARLSRQIHALPRRTARREAFDRCRVRLRPHGPRLAAIHASLDEQRAGVADARDGIEERTLDIGARPMAEADDQDRTKAGLAEADRKIVGSDHADRRQPRHSHEDRFRRPARGGVL